MNATRWVTLTEFCKHLGRIGVARVDETEKGWFIAWIDNSPKALAKAVSTSVWFLLLLAHLSYRKLLSRKRGPQPPMSSGNVSLLQNRLSEQRPKKMIVYLTVPQQKRGSNVKREQRKWLYHYLLPNLLHLLGRYLPD